MDDNNSPINDLFTDSEPVDVAAIVEVVKEYIRIKKNTKEVFFTENAGNANVIKRILAYGLGKKLLKIGGYMETEYFSAKEVAKDLRLKKGTVDGTFNVLKKKNQILGSGSEYIIPNYKITDVLNLLKKRNG